MPSTVTLAPWFARYTRSRYGKAYWQTGQLTLKNANTTGPFCSVSSSVTGFPCTVESVKPGARTPVLNVAINQVPPKTLRLFRTPAGLNLQLAQNLAR